LLLKGYTEFKARLKASIALAASKETPKRKTDDISTAEFDSAKRSKSDRFDSDGNRLGYIAEVYF
jgi:hypothetical protein